MNNYYQTLFKSIKIATSMKTKFRVLNSTCNNSNLNNSFLYCIVGDWSSYEILHYPHFNVPDWIKNILIVPFNISVTTPTNASATNATTVPPTAPNTNGIVIAHWLIYRE